VRVAQLELLLLVGLVPTLTEEDLLDLPVERMDRVEQKQQLDLLQQFQMVHGCLFQL
jgi:hypothetical protein